MSATGGTAGVRAKAQVLLLGALLLAAGLAIIATLDPAPPFSDLPFALPWFALIPAYVATNRFTIDFEFRKEARSITLTQLPLALGVIFLGPLWHLLGRLLAELIGTVALRRQPPMKVLYNVGSSTLELALASAAVALASRHDVPGPALWLALTLGLLVNDVLANLAFMLVMRALGVPLNRHAKLAPFLFAGASTVVFTSLAMVAISAVWTNPWTLAIIGLVAGGLSLAYRGHQRVSAQQHATERLYEFVKDLGAVDVSSPRADVVLDQVRVLLHARSLDLALSEEASSSWQHFVAREDQPLQRCSTQHSEIEHDKPLTDRMSAPLLGSQGVIGLLTASERMGSVRGFDIGDVRLLETLATELSAALERGRLLSDLERSATTDALTGLPNLHDVTTRIDALLANGDALVVAAVAVDSFREVNDTLGHQVGDDLLLEVARRLRVCVPDGTIGRIGGGRFAIAVRADSVGGDAAMFGLGLRAQVEGGAQLGAVGTHVRLSMGGVVTPDHGTDAATLIRRAETAMYSARHAQGGPVIWEPAYEVQGQRRLAVVTALREALSNGAIGVAFQPKVESRSGHVTGVEALARWTHPALGAIRPDEFIPLAEASGLMRPLTTTVLRQAVTACKGWQRRGGRIGVAVNISADTVLDPMFVTEVAAILTSVNLSPDLLTLELTEGVLVDDPALATERMAELRAHGVRLSVDDFGTGYSSLTYLKGLPMDEVKIDKGFVDAIASDDADRAVVRAVVDIAHTLGLRVVAEGVEQEEQQRVLHELGVDELQGYLHARPMPALEMAAWLRKRDSSVHA